jgi:MFS transporter, ACS family, tartrate transporter
MDAITPQHGAVTEEALMRKIMRRIIPFIFVCYVVSYLDRINVGFAALQMNKDIGLTPTEFGWGAGLFSIGYFICEIPSNLMLQRVGARRWIARIMISWGVVSTFMAFVSGVFGFSAARLLLGMAEAGFTPGVYLFFTYWFPGAWRARATTAFLVGIPVANMLGSPLSGWLLTFDGLLGLHGWQWLFVIEGLPAMLLGGACLAILSDGPRDATWLSPAERSWLVDRLTAEQADLASRHGARVRDAFSGRVLAFALVNFCGIAGSVGVGIWMPQIIKGFGVSTLATGFLAALPYAVAAVAMILFGRAAARSHHRTRYVVGALATAAVALAVSAVATSPAMSMVALVVTVCGILCFQATYWALPSAFLTGRAAAAGLALIVSIGNLGGFVGPFAIGALREQTHGFLVPLLSVAAILLAGALLMAFLADPSEQRGRLAVAPATR